jgi:pre-peptidase
MFRLRYAMILVLALPATVLAQSGRPQVTRDSYHDVSPPLREMPPVPHIIGALEAEPVRRIPSSRIPSFGPDPVLQAPRTGLAAALAPALVTNFDGVGNGVSGPAGTFTVNSAPPDTNAAVGPNHIVETVNTDLGVFSKTTGAMVFGPVPINTLWSGFGGGCQMDNDGDPIVTYDRIADRWIISQFQVTTTPFQQCVAVSQTSDPTGAYFRYAFNYSGFPDYPKMGVWPDAYYISYNMFNNAGTSFLGSQVCAFDRAKMLTGAPATQQCFSTSTSFGGLLPADLDGTFLPPAGAPNPVVALGATSTSLAYWKFHVDWATPANSTFTGPTTLTVPSYTEACGASGTCIPQSGGGSLDSLSDRLMYRAAYRTFADGHHSIVTNHAVTVGTNVGLRWYELRVDAASNLSVFQSGTYAPDAAFRWMGSAAMDQAGNIALGFSTSSSTTKPSIRYTGRLAGDATGTMTQGEGIVITGAGAQGSTLSRWGDYSSLQIDPVDDCTFWYANEYIPANGTFNWKTRIASFKLPGCGAVVANDFSIAANPASLAVTQGSSATSTINTAVTSGVAQSVSLSVSGTPAGATASVSPSTVTSGNASTLTFSAGTAAAGTYTLTITGTAASGSHSTSVSVTVTPPAASDFGIAASPASASVVSGGSATYTVTTTVISGTAESIALSISGVPAGASAGFAPATVTAGGSSTLTVSSGTAAVGTYTLTITGTAPSATHSTTVSLTISPQTPPDFTIAVSPASASVAAGSSTSYSVSTTAVNGSTQSIALSVSGLPSGVTGSFSPSTVTAGGASTLTISASATAAAGTTTFSVTGTSATTTHTASASVTVTTGAATLTDGVPVTNISGATGSQQFWVMNVPAGKDTLTISISGGSGDADLYVKFGSQPTTSVFDCRPFINGNNETCTFNAPAAGSYFVMIRGFATYSGVTLTGRTAMTPVLTSGVPVTGISGASGSQQFWKLPVPSGKTSLTFTISGGTGDADLYVRFGAKPTTTTFTCRPFLNGNNETCSITNPSAGDWYVMIRGFAAFSGVTLTGTYKP